MSSTPPLRNWQQEALLRLTAAWEDPGAKPLIAACPGSGKTLFSCVALRQALSDYKVELGIIVAPTINIKEQWREKLKDLGINAHASASNESLRFRRDSGEHITGGWTVICVTYSQLAQDVDLFVEIARRHKICFIADEVHHADDQESFGKAVTAVAENSTLRLALSGTPFNSTGGALAMCETKKEMDTEGRLIMRAIPTYTFSYGDALRSPDKPCRSVDFIKVFGKGVSTYKNLTTKEEWQKVVDLNQENKTDSLNTLLSPDSDFVEEMIQQALNEFSKIKIADKRAAMLVIGKDKNHTGQIAKRIESICLARGLNYAMQEIYNDTAKAHIRIKNLQGDSIDIIVSVRMISEGVDVPRIRVVLYLTDYLTRMFFVQVVGRPIRTEPRLDEGQYAVIIIPAHILLLTYAREIEQMVCESFLPEEGNGDGGGDSNNELLNNESSSTGVGCIGREKQEFDTLTPAEAWYSAHPASVGVIPPTVAARLALDEGLGHSASRAEPDTDWGRKNDILVGKISRHLEREGHSSPYQLVNARANREVGIQRKDNMTSESILKKRHKFLRKWLASLMGVEISD